MHTKIQCLNSTGYEPAKKNFCSSLHSCNLGIQSRSPKFVYIYVQSSVTVEGYCSVSVLCVHIHSSNAYTLAQHMSACPPPPPPHHPTTLGSVQRYRHCTKHGRSKLLFSFFAHVNNYIIIIYYISCDPYLSSATKHHSYYHVKSERSHIDCLHEKAKVSKK